MSQEIDLGGNGSLTGPGKEISMQCHNLVIEVLGGMSYICVSMLNHGKPYLAMEQII